MKINTLLAIVFIISFSKAEGKSALDLIREKIKIMKETTLKNPYPNLKTMKETTLKNPSHYLKSTKDLKFPLCFIGDTGTDYNQQKLSKNHLNHCEQVRHLGDIIYDLGIDGPEDKQIKTKFLNYYSPFKKPWFLIFGNHDYYGTLDPWFKLALKTPNLDIPHYFYAENYNGLCFVSIDSTPLYYDQDLSSPRTKEQITWLNTLKPALKKSCDFTMLITHYPYYSPTGRDAWKGLKLFYDKHIIGQFDVIMAGHEHLLSYDGVLKGTHNFISGSGGKGLREGQKINKRVFVKKAPGIIKMERVNKKTYRFLFEVPDEKTLKNKTWSKNSKKETVFKIEITGKGLR